MSPEKSDLTKLAETILTTLYRSTRIIGGRVEELVWEDRVALIKKILVEHGVTVTK